MDIKISFEWKSMLGNSFMLENMHFSLLSVECFNNCVTSYSVLFLASTFSWPQDSAPSLKKANTSLSNTWDLSSNKWTFSIFPPFQQSVKLYRLVESHNSITVPVCGRKGKSHYFRSMCCPNVIRKVLKFVFLMVPTTFFLSPSVHLPKERGDWRSFHLKQTTFFEIKLI